MLESNNNLFENLINDIKTSNEPEIIKEELKKKIIKIMKTLPDQLIQKNFIKKNFNKIDWL